MARLQQAVAILAFLTLTFVAQGALAAPISGRPLSATPTPQATPPQNAQGGINTLVQPPPIQGQSQPLLFEQYGPLDYAGLTTSVGANVVNDAGNAWAQSEATAIYLLGIVATRIVEWSFSLNLVSRLGPMIDLFTQGLENSLYQRFLPLVLVLAAIVAGWTLLVMRKFLSGLTGLVWAGLTISLALQFFGSASTYLDGASQFADGVTNSIVVGVAHEDPSAPPGSHQQQTGDANYEVRLLANRLWTVAVYDPWTMIEFGTVDPRVNGDQLGVELLKKNDGQPNSYNQNIAQAPQWIQQWADGNWGMPRAVFGFFMVMLGGILLIFTLLIALAVIIGTLTAILLACLTVPVWLLAPIPGFGQRLLTSWFGGIVAGLAVSTIGALYLVLVLALLGAVALLVGTAGLVTVGLLDVSLIVVAVWLRKMFFNFGRHGARLPMALAAGARLPLPTPQVEETGTVSHFAHRQMSRARTRMTAPINSYTARQTIATGTGKAAAAKGGATAARAGASTAAKGGGTAAAATEAGLATAGLALAAVAALKAGQGALHVHDAARRRTQAATAQAMGVAAQPGRVPLHHDGRGEPSVLMGTARVGVAGIRAWRARRVAPPADEPNSLPPGDVGRDHQTSVARTRRRRTSLHKVPPRLEGPK